MASVRAVVARFAAIMQRLKSESGRLGPVFWVLCLAIVSAFCALNFQFRSSMPSTVVPTGQYDGRVHRQYARHYGWPYPFLTIANAYDSYKLSAASPILYRTTRIRWSRLAINGLCLLVVLTALARTIRRTQERPVGVARWVPIRFGLRGFLLSITLFAAWLGYTIHKGTVQKRLLDDFRSREGKVVYEYNWHGVLPGMTSPIAQEPKSLLRSLFGRECCLPVLHLGFRQVDGDYIPLLEKLAQIDGVEGIELGPTALNPDLIRVLKQFPELKSFGTVMSESDQTKLAAELPGCTVFPMKWPYSWKWPTPLVLSDNGIHGVHPVFEDGYLNYGGEAISVEFLQILKQTDRRDYLRSRGLTYEHIALVEQLLDERLMPKTSNQPR